MSPQQQPVPGASAQFEIRPTAKFVILAYALVGLITVASLIAAIKLQAPTQAIYAIVAVDLLITIWIVSRHLRLQFTRLALDHDKLRFEEGFLSKSTRMLNAGKIQDVSVHQGITGRILGIGTITIQTAGESGGLVMENIDQPRQVADRILSVSRHLPNKI